MTIFKIIHLLTLIIVSSCHVSFYDLLGVDREFTQESLKDAFDKKSSIVGSGVSSERLKKAYETLSNRIDRKIYDIYGEVGLTNKLFVK